MFRLVRGVGLMTLLGAFILPVCGADVKKAPTKRIDEVEKDEKTEKTTDKKPGKEKVEVDPYVTVGTFEGQVKQVEAGTKTFTLELINRQPDLQDVAANANRMAQLQQQLIQQQAQANRNNGFNQQAIF